MLGLMSDMVTCKFRKSMVIHDTECPYWDQVSLNNTQHAMWKMSLHQPNMRDATTDTTDNSFWTPSEHLWTRKALPHFYTQSKMWHENHISIDSLVVTVCISCLGKWKGGQEHQHTRVFFKHCVPWSILVSVVSKGIPCTKKIVSTNRIRLNCSFWRRLMSQFCHT